MTRTAAAVDSRYPFWVRNEGYEETLVQDQADHFALLAERGLPATPLPSLPPPVVHAPPSDWIEYPKSVGAVVVEDAEEERMARAIDAGDPDAAAELWARLSTRRGQRQTAQAASDPEQGAYCEFPKWVDGPVGRIVVHSATAEEATRKLVAAKAAETIAFLPSAEVRKLLDQAAKDGRDLSGVINEALDAPKADAVPVKSAGRPTAWRDEFPAQAMKLCRSFGATDAQLADVFGVDDRTLARWKAAKPEFCQALEEGRAG
jgi:hypothetical protein